MRENHEHILTEKRTFQNFIHIVTPQNAIAGQITRSGIERGEAGESEKPNARLMPDLHAKKKQRHTPGIEPGSCTFRSTTLTATPRGLVCNASRSQLFLHP